MNTQLEELACLYVLDRLDERERAAFEARLANDPELVALMRELEDALARRIRALPRHEPPAGLLSAIESRIDGVPSHGERAPARAASPAWASFARWGIAAVIAVGVATVAVQDLRRAPAAAQPYVIVVGLDSLRSTLAELPVKVRPANADASFVQLATLAERFWDKPEDLPVKLDSAGQSGRGYALFDPASNQGFIAIRQLPAAGEGKQYHLWLIDTSSGQIREAGVLPAAESARGLYFFSVAPTSASKPGRLNFFVTAEDSAAPESAEPRGKVVLGDRSI
jgi:anti-sigma-K factor RskA